MGIIEKKFAQIAAMLVFQLTACICSSFADTAGSNAPISSSLGHAIQSLFSEQSPQTPTEPSEDIFGLELASLEYLDEQAGSLDTGELKSKKVLVYFWSVYCRGCIAPLRELEGLRSTLRDSGIELVSVHLFESDKVYLMNRLAQLSLGLPVLFGANEIRDSFSVRVLPTALAYDEQHRQIARFDGGFDLDKISLKLTTRTIEQAEKADSSIQSPTDNSR